MDDIFVIRKEKPGVKKVCENNQKTNKLKGLRIQTVSLWVSICTILVSILIGHGILNVKKQYHHLTRMTRRYIITQDDAMDMSLGSDHLTEQARLYVITKEQLHADAYFMEINVTQRRERALLEIEKNLSGNDENTLQMSKTALKLSNDLTDREIHAMKLAALSADADISKLSPEIQNYTLSAEELQYSQQEQSDAASKLVFGQEYRSKKKEIDETLSKVTKSAIQTCETTQRKSEAAMKKALTLQSIYAVISVLLVILAYAIIAVLIIKPIKMYIDCIKNNNILEVKGAYKFKYLAATYNDIYETSVTQHDLLRQKVEHDILTELPNRQAFEHIKTGLRTFPDPIALVLVDIDLFKSINNTYGHEIGDCALIRTAGLLKESFRSTDYVFRISGDEFALILLKISPECKRIVGSKIDRINRTLQHPPKDLPKYSISAGIAFSDIGYTDELFRQAEKALFGAKENGRCGYTFSD